MNNQTIVQPLLQGILSITIDGVNIHMKFNKSLRLFQFSRLITSPIYIPTWFNLLHNKHTKNSGL